MDVTSLFCSPRKQPGVLQTIPILYSIWGVRMRQSLTGRSAMRLLTFCLMMCSLAVLMSAQTAYIKMISPAKGDRYGVPTTITISYALENPKASSANGSTFSISYSSDGGKSWNVLKSGIDPFTTSYDWPVYADQTLSTSYMIRITESCATKKCAIVHYTTDGPMFEIYKACSVPVITAQPQSKNVCSGTSVTLSVNSTAVSATYNWYKGAALVSSSRINSYTINSIATTHAGDYFATIVEDCGEKVTTATATLNVTQAPTITVNPVASVQACAQTSATLQVGATGSGITYQWRFNGNPIPGATNSTLFLDPLTASSDGLYDVVVSGVCTPSVTSTQTKVSVIAKPIITKDLENIQMCPGAAGQISVAATGTSLFYQWYRDGQPIPNSTSPTLTFANVTPSVVGRYKCIITSGTAATGCPSLVSSADAFVTVLQAPKIVKQPSLVNACTSNITELVVEADGFGLNYQWSKNGSPLPNSNSHVLVLRDVTPAMAGTYTATVTGVCGFSVTSAPITVRATTAPTFTQQPLGTSINAGQSIELNAAATDFSTVQWYRNSIPLPGATQWKYAVSAASQIDAGIYYAIATNACGSRVSSQAHVVVNEVVSNLPELTLNPATVDFGDVPSGYSKLMTVDNFVRNTGTAPLTVNSLTVVGSGFTITNAPAVPFVLQPNQTASVSIQANTPTTGAQEASIMVTSNAPTPNAEVALTATGVLFLSHQPELDFHGIENHTTRDMCATVQNTSSSSVSIEDMSIVGADAQMFSLITTAPINIAAGASTDLCIRFAPTRLGDVTAQLAIMSSTAGNTTIGLAGAAAEVTGVELDAASVMSLHPNPTSGSVTLRLTDFSASRIDIVSVSGTIIRTLSLDASINTLTWDGLDAGGSPAATGAYLMVVHGTSGVVSMPISVIR